MKIDLRKGETIEIGVGWEPIDFLAKITFTSDDKIILEISSESDDPEIRIFGENGEEEQAKSCNAPVYNCPPNFKGISTYCCLPANHEGKHKDASGKTRKDYKQSLAKAGYNLDEKWRPKKKSGILLDNDM